VGDAAGQVKPTTGGGLYFGLICADIAATTLHNALHSGNLSSSGLSVYQRDWRRKLKSELRREYYARKIFERLNDKQINRLVSALNSTGLIESLLLDKSLSFDWHGGLMLKTLRLGLLSQFRKVLHLPLPTAHQ
jgi:flavin-dependent dehydrogenase